MNTSLKRSDMARAITRGHTIYLPPTHKPSLPRYGSFVGRIFTMFHIPSAYTYLMPSLSEALEVLAPLFGLRKLEWWASTWQKSKM